MSPPPFFSLKRNVENFALVYFLAPSNCHPFPPAHTSSVLTALLWEAEFLAYIHFYFLFRKSWVVFQWLFFALREMMVPAVKIINFSPLTLLMASYFLYKQQKKNSHEFSLTFNHCWSTILLFKVFTYTELDYRALPGHVPSFTISVLCLFSTYAWIPSSVFIFL